MMKIKNTCAGKLRRSKRRPKKIARKGRKSKYISRKKKSSNLARKEAEEKSRRTGARSTERVELIGLIIMV